MPTALSLRPGPAVRRHSTFLFNFSAVTDTMILFLSFKVGEPLRYVIAFLISIHLPRAFASPISVSFDGQSYEVNLMQNSVAFKETGFSESVKKQKCNRMVFDLFTNELKANQTPLADMKKADIPKGSITVSIEGNTKVAFRNANEGKYFLDLPSKFKNLWLTSRKVCQR